MPKVEIPVLVYHRIGVAPAHARHPDTYVHPRAFARQMALLKALGYRTIVPDDYIKLRQGRPCRVPPKPILITFDDGSATVLSEGLPLLKRHGFVAMVFMVSSRLGGPAVWDGETEASGHRQLTSAELRVLRGEGWTIGSHTVTHPRLIGLAAPERAKELADSKNELEAALGQEAACFAYPYGDFDPGLREAVSRAGYRIAFATENGDGNALSIPRRIISGRGGALRFLWRLRQARRMARR
ncbi:MAG TPA: polysaccharide deacetylase family protein [Elusimicrobiota bacterium]|nr:polysaccharide deacetylase family protein [Elusimicrobiota bacterium]